MKIKYLLLLFFIITTLTNAQEQTVWSNSSLSANYDGRSNSGEWAIRTREAFSDLRYNVNRTLSDYEIEEILGNAYYNKEFVLGKVYVNNQMISKNFAFRYNAFSDEIEVGRDEATEVMIKKPEISCLIGKELYIFHSYTKKENGDIYNGYLRTITKGKEFSFFIRETKIFKEAKEAKNTLTTSFPAKLVDVKEFYLLEKQNDNAILIKQKNKKVMELIDPPYKSEMSKYLKDNNLNVKENEDLILFFRYYSNLTNKK